MSIVKVDNGDGTSTFTDTATGRAPTVANSEIARLKAIAVALRATRNPPMIEATVFLGRMTDSEYLAAMAAAQAQAQTGNATILRWIEEVRATNKVFVNSERAQSAKAAFVGAGILTQERADIVFEPST